MSTMMSYMWTSYERVVRESDAWRSRMQDAGLLLIRAILGGVFLGHGLMRIFGIVSARASTFADLDALAVSMPWYASSIIGGVELIAGLALMLGIGAPVAAGALMLASIAVAAFAYMETAAAGWGAVEYPLLMAAMAAGLCLTGPGRWTADTLTRWAFSEWRGSRSSNSGRAAMA